jgi:hypothetical protein
MLFYPRKLWISLSISLWTGAGTRHSASPFAKWSKLGQNDQAIDLQYEFACQGETEWSHARLP